ncbi:MAG: hypothetical protein KKG04_03125 [Candidatus Thermoplasmatota archaeon]|nr:hypothetical protein [Candidatus Thermoplasmatota archaeon]
MSQKIWYSLIIFILLSCTGCIETEPTPSLTDVDSRLTAWYNIPSILPLWTDENYHDYYATMSALYDYQTRYDHLIDLFSIGTSVSGKTIWCIKLTNEASSQTKTSCLIDGCIHGSEWESGEACLYLAEYLLINFAQNTTISMLLNTTNVYILPIVNPDGRQKDYRYNDNGIDLNRNFNVHFGRLRGHSIPLGKLFGRIQIPRIDIPIFGFLTNSGRRPFSEPESRALRDIMKDLSSQRFSFYINCHTATHQILYPWSTFKPIFTISSQQNAVFTAVTSWITKNSEYDSTKLGYKASGTAMDWCFMKYEVPCFTFEILSEEYEPRSGGGRHDNLVHWMKTTLPVFMFLLMNSESLHKWEIPLNKPLVPKGVPPVPLY